MRNSLRLTLRPRRAWPVALALFAITLVGCDGALPATVSLPAGSPTVAKATSTPVVNFSRPEVEVGIAVPRWNAKGYSVTDTTFQKEVAEMQATTGSRWVTLVFNLHETSYTSTEIGPTASTPTPEYLRQGIEYAHSLGLKVYIEPLLRVGDDGWGGWLTFSSYTMATNWFNSYWAALKPYFAVAQQAGAEQMSIGTEFQKLELMGNSLWEGLIANAHKTYSGQLIYGVNYNSGSIKTPPAWMHDPALFALGISAWWPIKVDTRKGEPGVATLLAFWRQKVLPVVDAFSVAVGHPVLFSEIGYRNAADALNDPFNVTSTTPADPTLQATAYTAAAQAVFGDKHIVGILFWAWKNELFDPSAQTTAAMHAAFRSPQA